MNINGMKILSIDDNKNSLLIIEDFTEPLSLNIDSFEDPQKALLSSESIEYDLVVVDYLMPKLNGLEFIKAFRKNNSDVPIIMLTAVEDDIDLQIEALRLGANDFLTKPINSAVLSELMRPLTSLQSISPLSANWVFGFIKSFTVNVPDRLDFFNSNSVSSMARSIFLESGVLSVRVRFIF